MVSDPKTLLIAILGGVLPALIWLWFWLREDEEQPEPIAFITLIFLIGMVSVVFVVPVEKFVQNHTTPGGWQIIAWASIEELFKYLSVIIILYKTNKISEPIDWPVLLITAALGFAAVENTMFLLKPLALNQTIVGLFTGQLRFLGSTLLHAVSSAVIGIALGLSFFMNKYVKKLYLLVGFILAITLHSAFNFFIMKADGSSYLKTMGFLWVVTVVILLVFEKIRRMSEVN